MGAKRMQARWTVENRRRGSMAKAKRAKKKNRSIEDSQVVPYLSTNSTITDLTSQIGRDAVLSSVYGRG